MIEILRWLGILIRAAVGERRDLALENLAIRQQLVVLKRRKGVPRLRRKDRLFWVVLSRIWAPWRRVLHLVKADTVVGWQQKGFRIYWARVSQRKKGGSAASEFGAPRANPADGGRQPVLVPVRPQNSMSSQNQRLAEPASPWTVSCKLGP